MNHSHQEKEVIPLYSFRTTDPKVVLLWSSLSTNRHQTNAQKRMQDLLLSKGIRFELLDGSQKENTENRNKFFSISKIRGKYPQLFIALNNGQQINFIGMDDSIDELVDSEQFDTIFAPTFQNRLAPMCISNKIENENKYMKTNENCETLNNICTDNIEDQKQFIDVLNNDNCQQIENLMIIPAEIAENDTKEEELPVKQNTIMVHKEKIKPFTNFETLNSTLNIQFKTQEDKKQYLHEIHQGITQNIVTIIQDDMKLNKEDNNLLQKIITTKVTNEYKESKNDLNDLKGAAFQFRLNLPHKHWMENSLKMEKQLKTEIAKTLNIDANLIEIVDVKSGSTIVDWYIRNIWFPVIVNKLFKDNPPPIEVKERLKTQTQIEVKYKNKWYAATIVSITYDPIYGQQFKIHFNPKSDGKKQFKFPMKNTAWFYTKKEGSKLRLPSKPTIEIKSEGDQQTKSILFEQPKLAGDHIKIINDLAVGHHIFVLYEKTAEKWCRSVVVQRGFNEIKIVNLVSGDSLKLDLFVDASLKVKNPKISLIDPRDMEHKANKTAADGNILKNEGVDTNRDDLTGLHLKPLLEKRLMSLCQQNQMAAFIATDMDNMKELNQNGHHIADNVLQSIGIILKQRGETAGIEVFRYYSHGDEFGIIITDQDENGIVNTAEEIRKTIEYSTKATVSMGIAIRKDKETKDVWFGRAEAALERAKKEGKNRICCSETQPKSYNVRDLLKEWGLQSYEKTLIDINGYDDITDWFDLTEDQLKEIDFKVGHAKRFVKKVALLKK